MEFILVPNVYPVDMFEHLWAVDRLQRLGISRYFQPEITQSLEYVYRYDNKSYNQLHYINQNNDKIIKIIVINYLNFRYWTKEGICWARNSHVHDIDDTSMGFRLLRLHGFDVSAGKFRKQPISIIF